MPRRSGVAQELKQETRKGERLTFESVGEDICSKAGLLPIPWTNAIFSPRPDTWN